MCGIAGFVNLDGLPADPAVLEKMIRTLHYRGPDGTGAHLDGPLGLAHNRLSIIDIGGGHQPMECDDGSLWISFNGEIFNFVELRADLEKKGHRFRTHSDTEVILKAYQQYGVECVHYLNGQWAFAIWDASNHRLFLSRDRLGVRPLFHAVFGNTFLFGSEVKALLAHPEADAKLNLEALRQVFTFWFPIPPETIFKNVHELPPAHSLIVENGKIHLQRYWQLDYSRVGTDASPAAEKRYLEEFNELLLDATRIRLRADVPVGAYLSGGLDSSIIAALAKQCVQSSLCTFSIAFDDPALDESVYQREVVNALGTQHQMIRCSSSDISAVFPDVIMHTERPVIRTAPAPMYLLSKLVRDRGFKVVLTGEGSDEFLGGYDIYKEAKIRAFWAAQIGSEWRPNLLRRLYPYLAGMQKQSPAYLRAFFHVEHDSVANPYFSHLPRWDVTSKTQAFFSQDVRSELNGRDAYAGLKANIPDDFAGWGTFARAQYLEAAFLLPNYLLSSQGDRVAMAHSVEGRYPFLDYRIVEFSTRLPICLKMKVLREKYLLKKAFGDLVPAAVLQRPKQPYRAPDVASFFDRSTGRARHDYVDELLSPDRVRADGVFDANAVQRLVNKARAGNVTSFAENAALVGILSTQILIEKFISHQQEPISYGANWAASSPVHY
jgi:asparagine synthase (glutamine-hydrolysing)